MTQKDKINVPLCTGLRFIMADFNNETPIIVSITLKVIKVKYKFLLFYRPAE